MNELFSIADFLHRLHECVHAHLPGDQDGGQRAQVLLLAAGPAVFGTDLERAVWDFRIDLIIGDLILLYFIIFILRDNIRRGGQVLHPLWSPHHPIIVNLFIQFGLS